MQNADVALLSSDGVPFHVHNSILSMSSPFFHDMFSLPQPPNSKLVDGLPAVRLSEPSELLQYLISSLYPIPSVIPAGDHDSDEVLDLLAVSHKYDMAAIQSFIGAEIKSKDLRPLTAAATFRAYGFASTKVLKQEMESAPRVSLEYPMTFES
jgi:BTB/POZ domain